MLFDTYKGSVSHKRKSQQKKVSRYDNDTTYAEYYNSKRLSDNDCGNALQLEIVKSLTNN